MANVYFLLFTFEMELNLNSLIIDVHETLQLVKQISFGVAKLGVSIRSFVDHFCPLSFGVKSTIH